MKNPSGEGHIYRQVDRGAKEGYDDYHYKTEAQAKKHATDHMEGAKELSTQTEYATTKNLHSYLDDQVTNSGTSAYKNNAATETRRFRLIVNKLGE